MADYFNRKPVPNEPILFNIGQTVITKPDDKDSYIARVIGTKRKGVVISNCTIPLVDFGNGNEYYIYQNKLKLTI